MASGAGLGETAGGEDAVDGDGEPDFGVFLVGVGEAEIGEDIAGAFDDGNFTVVLWSGFLWHGVPHVRRGLRAVFARLGGHLFAMCECRWAIFSGKHAVHRWPQRT